MPTVVMNKMYDNEEYLSQEEMDWAVSINNTVKDITDDANHIANMWAGFVCDNHRTLTPDYLSDLKNKCLHLLNDIDSFYFILDDVINHSDEWFYYADCIQEIDFELAVARVVIKSYEFSSGVSQGEAGVLLHQKSDFKHLTDIQKKMLLPVTVKPWTMPEVKLDKPEKPAVVLAVLSVSDSAPRVSAGFDDVFLSDTLVTDLLVDEDVKVGDKIIIKTDGWDGFGSYLLKPEFDGIAEPTCPCSDVGEITAIDYAQALSDYEVIKAQLHADLKLKWLDDNFVQKSGWEIETLGSTALYPNVYKPTKSAKKVWSKDWPKEYRTDVDFSNMYYQNDDNDDNETNY